MIFWNRKEYLKDWPYHKKETCPICKDKEFLIKKTKHWKILYNKFPYYGNKQNLLVAPIKHKTYTKDLSDEELVDYKNVEKFMSEYFQDKNYFSFIKQWTWWRSIEHLHYHYLEWIIDHNVDNNKQFNIINIS